MKTVFQTAATPLEHLMGHIRHVEGHGFVIPEDTNPRHMLTLYFGQVSGILQEAEALGLVQADRLTRHGSWKASPAETNPEMLESVLRHVKKIVLNEKRRPPIPAIG